MGNHECREKSMAQCQLSRCWCSEFYTWTDLSEENLVVIPNQRTRTQNLAVMTISLKEIAAEG